MVRVHRVIQGHLVLQLVRAWLVQQQQHMEVQHMALVGVGVVDMG